MKLLCRQPPYRLAPAPSCQCPRQESSLVCDLRGVACKSLTLRGHISVQRPAEESNLVRQFRRLPCFSGTPTGHSFKRLDQDLNLDLDLRRVLCDPMHHRDIHSIPTWSRTRSGTDAGLWSAQRESPMRSATPSGQTYQGRRLDLHQHHAVYRTAAFLNRATSAIQAGVQGFEPCGAALEAASSPRRTLLYRLRSRRTGGFGVTTTLSASRSSTLR